MRELKVGDWVRVVDWPGDSPILGVVGQVTGKTELYWKVRPEPEVQLSAGLREWLCKREELMWCHGGEVKGR